MITGQFMENKVRISQGIQDLHSKQYYGKIVDSFLDLSLVEAMHLVDKKLISVTVSGKKASNKKIYSLFCSVDKEFPQKFVVYCDLRERGYIVKSGFKFGTHFRVYPRGVNPYKEGPKEQKEHTKWVVHAVAEDYQLSYHEMSRAVRLAQNIRTTMLWAVVDSENGVTFYEFIRIRP